MYNGEREPNAKTRSKQTVAVGEGSNDFNLVYIKTMQKKSGMGSGSLGDGRRAGGPEAPLPLPLGFYDPYFSILHAPAEYKNDLEMPGCGGNPNPLLNSTTETAGS